VTPLPGDTARTEIPLTAAPAAPPTAQPAAPPVQTNASAPPPPPPPPTFARYRYLSPPAPAPGDRAAAERAFAQGRQLQLAGRLNEAAAAYRQAAEADPTYFEAHFNLGLVLFELRNHRQSLAAWEHALALRPDSTDARYNFALALKAADYPRDAAAELERILTQNTNETRAHLVLGNLYAGPLRDPARARAHYLRVLELDPRHSQAAAIRFWLAQNPP
jgi:tetratricopeptide (TPR) repeat protein